MKITPKKYFLILVVISLIIMVIFYQKVIFQPNQMLFESSGDALKNYYTYAYFVKNDTSYTESACVNYPYGEHFSYLDAQPAVAFPVKILADIFPGVADYSIGILNFCLIFSILICIIFLYRILLEFNVGHWYAIASAISISLLSPQFFRLSGHYGMFYLFFIPMSWYFFIRFIKEGKLKYTLYIVLSVTIFFFLHAYLGMISLMFLGLNWILYLAFNRKEFKKLKNYLHLMLQLLVPLVIFFLIMRLTDHHTDRTENPAGIYLYVADTSTIFLPYNVELQKIYRLIFNIGEHAWEGVGYVGTFVNLALISLILYLIYLIFKRKKSHLREFIPGKMMIYFISSVIILLFSMALPYKWGLDFLLDYIKELRQFRGLGRFSWVFFYVSNVFVAIYLYNIFRHLKSRGKIILGSALLVLSQLIIFAEAYTYQKTFSENVVKNKNYFKYSKLPDNYKEALSKIDRNQFQAILPLPYYNFGSEDFIIYPSPKSSNLAMLLAYHKNMSIMSCNTGRTSVTEAKNSIQILMPEYYTKAIKNDIKSTKPFLVIFTNETLSGFEQRLYNMSEVFYENQEFKLAKLDFDKLFYENKENVLKNYMVFNDSLHRKNNLVISDTSVFVHVDNYDGNNSQIYFTGNGCHRGLKKDYNILAEFGKGKLNPEFNYSVSFWFYNKGYGRTFSHSVIEEYDESTGVSEYVAYSDVRFCPVICGDWSFMELWVKPKNNSCSYKVFLKPIENWVDSVYVDNLVVRPVDVDVFSVHSKNKKGVLFYNNQFIETDIDFAVLDCSREIIIEFYSEMIRSADDWLSQIKEQAISQKKSLDEMIYLNAEYMALECGFNITDNKDLQIMYYSAKIRSSEDWLNAIINNPANKGKNIDSLIYGNALYMIQN